MILAISYFLIYAFHSTNFSVQTTFAISPLRYFHYHLAQNLFKTLLRFLFWSMCCLDMCLISQYLGIFLAIFLLFISYIILLWSQHTLYNFYSFKFANVYFMAPNAYFGKSFMWALEDWCVVVVEKKWFVNYIQLISIIFSRCQIYPVDWWSHWIQLCSDFLLAGFVHFE